MNIDPPPPVDTVPLWAHFSIDSNLQRFRGKFIDTMELVTDHFETVDETTLLGELRAELIAGPLGPLVRSTG